jgi:hypothetical protein
MWGTFVSIVQQAKLCETLSLDFWSIFPDVVVSVACHVLIKGKGFTWLVCMDIHQPRPCLSLTFPVGNFDPADRVSGADRLIDGYIYHVNYCPRGERGIEEQLVNVLRRDRFGP